MSSVKAHYFSESNNLKLKLMLIHDPAGCPAANLLHKIDHTVPHVFTSEWAFMQFQDSTVLINSGSLIYSSKYMYTHVHVAVGKELKTLGRPLT